MMESQKRMEEKIRCKIYFFLIIKNTWTNQGFNLYDCLPTVWQFFCSTPEDIRWFGIERFIKPILKRDVFIKGNFLQVVGWRLEEIETRYSKIKSIGRVRFFKLNYENDLFNLLLCYHVVHAMKIYRELYFQQILGSLRITLPPVHKI